MFKVTIHPSDALDEYDYVTYDVRFHHHRKDLGSESEVLLNRRSVNYRGVTTCEVMTRIDENVMVKIVGKAYCSWKDTFDKKKGRFLALDRVMSYFPPDIRELIKATHKELTGRFETEETKQARHSKNKALGLKHQAAIKALAEEMDNNVE